VAIWLREIFIAVLAGWLLLSEFATSRGDDRPPSGIPTLSYDDRDGEADEVPPSGPPESGGN
jgi:hypothetical protein